LANLRHTPELQTDVHIREGYSMNSNSRFARAGFTTSLSRNADSRRGVIAVFTAFLMIMMLAMVAFAVDVGYMMTQQAQLQVAADSAALAGAANQSAGTSAVLNAVQNYGGYYTVGGKTVSIGSSDVQYGNWNSSSRAFTSSGSIGNAVKVTARRDNTTGGNGTFFGRVLGLSSFSIPVSAVAVGNPRDICFVVDLSGSMNDDTTTGYGGSPSYRSSGYTSQYQTMMQQVFTDFSFGTYPGTTQKIGQPIDSSATWSSSGSHGLYSTSGPLSSSSISSTYRILSSDSSSTRQSKAYKWMIDNQIAVLMPNAKPSPNSGNTASYNYWQSYLSTIVGSSSNVIGYRTYVSWLMTANGRDTQPGGQYGQLSVNSSNCPYHTEQVPTNGGTSFSFPPSEQPTHSQRRSVIAGIQEVQKHNSTVSDPNQQDWVSIVTFDKTNDVQTRVALTTDYTSAMTSATTMQAVADNASSTDTEEGLLQAYNLIKPASQGGTGRENTQKIVLLLTDGVANLHDSSNSTISAYEAAHPSTYNGVSNYYGSSDYNSDAAFIQANTMQGKNWQVYSLGIGLAVDWDFMDKMARQGGTADNNGQAPRTSGDPSSYESEMTTLLDKIIDNPEVRLVQ
jgi:Flp pilus assembly protein TadG